MVRNWNYNICKLLHNFIQYNLGLQVFQTVYLVCYLLWRIFFYTKFSQQICCLSIDYLHLSISAKSIIINCFILTYFYSYYWIFQKNINLPWIIFSLQGKFCFKSKKLQFLFVYFFNDYLLAVVIGTLENNINIKLLLNTIVTWVFKIILFFFIILIWQFDSIVMKWNVWWLWIIIFNFSPILSP